MSEEAERTVVGTISGIEEKTNDWYAIKIAVPGKQYPVIGETKLEHLIDQARAVRDAGVVATFTIKDVPQFDRDGTPRMNPKSGKQYENHYLQSIEEGVTAGAAQSQDQGSGSNVQDVDWDAKERRDYRSRAWAQTISALTHTIKVDEEPADIYRRLYTLQRMIYRDIVRDLDPEAFDGDDIPF